VQRADWMAERKVVLTGARWAALLAEVTAMHKAEHLAAVTVDKRAAKWADAAAERMAVLRAAWTAVNWVDLWESQLNRI